ncbi:MAG: phospholipase [Pseudomonadota bacterium]
MTDPHADAPIVRAGPTGATAPLAAIALHGRGAGPEDMINLIKAVGAVDVAIFAPTASGNSWYPPSFLAPHAALEPHLSSALNAIDRAFDAAAAEGFANERIVLIGFSQGACISLEHTARRGRRVRQVLGLSGGLLGTADLDAPPADDLYGHAPKAFTYTTRLDGLPIHLGCHEEDPHIPLRRVRESEAVLTALGAACSMAIAPGPGHALAEADVTALRRALTP